MDLLFRIEPTQSDARIDADSSHSDASLSNIPAETFEWLIAAIDNSFIKNIEER